MNRFAKSEDGVTARERGGIWKTPIFDLQELIFISLLPRFSRYYAAPTMHHAILASKPEGVDARTATSIKMIANAAGGLLPSLAIQLKETFGDCAVLPSYGMTEW